LIIYILEFIAGVIGAYFFGFFGFFGGIILFFILSKVIVKIASLFNIGPYNKKDVQQLVKRFIEINENQIVTIEKYKSLNIDELTKLFSKYITEIHDSAIKLDNPVKNSKHDLKYAYYRDNFVSGGYNWASSVKEENEKILRIGFVNFCENWMYDGIRI